MGYGKPAQAATTNRCNKIIVVARDKIQVFFDEGCTDPKVVWSHASRRKRRTVAGIVIIAMIRFSGVALPAALSHYPEHQTNPEF